ncbi:MAG: site-specific integrase, partial [Halobacteriovoraceae bacterium]|nr:site-specific integrase [Halobacteriovoraceae bacterium]
MESQSNPDLLVLQNRFYKKLQLRGRTSNTLKNYRVDLGCFNQFLLEEQNNLEINKFNLAKIKAYSSFLYQKYNSDNSRRRRVQTLRLFFDFLVQERFFPDNPVRDIPTSPKFLDIPRPTSLEDIKKLWPCLIEDSHSKKTMERLLAKRNQVIVLLIFGGGLKISDLVKLKNKHIIIDKSSRVIITPR